MDSELRWESSLWSNQQNGIEESLVVSDNNSNAYCVGKHMDLIPPEDALAAELSLINGLMSDFGMSQPMNYVLTPTRSLDSIDCLLSASNSNADVTASVEDDGISMIFFADYENNRSSSSNKKKITNIVTNKEIQCCHDESVSSVEHDKKVTEKSPKSSSSKNSENPREPKKPRLWDKRAAASSNINFQLHPSSSVSSSSSVVEEPDPEAIAHMKEMIYRAAAFRPVNLGFEVEEKPRRKNVKISSDPQTVAARQRRERIGKKIRVLQKLVPGGSKMDTASMLDEAANYLKFLRSQVNAFENLSHKLNSTSLTFSSSSLPLFNIHSFPMEPYIPTHLKPYQSNPNPLDLC